MTIRVGVVSAAKDSTRSKGMPKFSPELYSKMWVPVIYHIVRQAKLFDNTLENNCATCLALSSPAPKVHAVKTVYLVKRSTHVKIALQPFAHRDSLLVK